MNTHQPLQTAVILAAGFGSRLARHNGDLKPLRSVGGASLIRRNLEMLDRAGFTRAIVVVGYHSEPLIETVESELADLDIHVIFAENREYHKANGISVLTAAPYVGGRFLLMMADHIFDPAIVQQAKVASVPENGAVLMTDSKIDEVYDYFMDAETDSLDDAEAELDDDITLDEIRLVRIKFFSEEGN